MATTLVLLRATVQFAVNRKYNGITGDHISRYCRANQKTCVQASQMNGRKSENDYHHKNALLVIQLYDSPYHPG